MKNKTVKGRPEELDFLQQNSKDKSTLAGGGRMANDITVLGD